MFLQSNLKILNRKLWYKNTQPDVQRFVLGIQTYYDLEARRINSGSYLTVSIVLRVVKIFVAQIIIKPIQL